MRTHTGKMCLATAPPAARDSRSAPVMRDSPARPYTGERPYACTSQAAAERFTYGVELEEAQGGVRWGRGVGEGGLMGDGWMSLAKVRTGYGGGWFGMCQWVGRLRGIGDLMMRIDRGCRNDDMIICGRQKDTYGVMFISVVASKIWNHR